MPLEVLHCCIHSVLYLVINCNQHFVICLYIAEYDIGRTYVHSSVVRSVPHE